MLKLYNTLTRGKQEFKPLVPGEARIYVCGMTDRKSTRLNSSHW